MRIADTSTGHGVVVEEEQDDSTELRAVALRLMPRWLELFARKNVDYGSGAAFELGIRGQYSDIHRKVLKLKRAMWDGHDMAFEGTEEIILDLISHLFLTIHMMEVKEDSEREYVYNDEEAAVDSFFRTIGGNTNVALRLAGALLEPFGDMVRKRAIAMQDQEEAEAVARVNGDEPHSLEDEDGGKVYTGKPMPFAFDSPEWAEGDAAQHGVGVSPPVTRSLGYAPTESRYEADAPDIGKPRPPRVVAEMFNGRIRYYSQSDLGADIEPLVLVPRAIIDQMSFDHRTVSAEQEARLMQLKQWAER